MVAASFRLLADMTWLCRTAEVKRLEANLAKVVPEATPRQLRRISRRGMGRHLRYYREALTMGTLSPEGINRRVRLENHDKVLAEIGPSRQAILVLGHMGNWDAAGAWACQNIAPVTTVAERIKPESVYADFVRMRNQIGMTIIPIKKGEPTLPRLIEATKSPDPFLICILADRDLSKGGVEVDWFGRKALMGAGPAALALATGLPLYPVSMPATRKGYVLRFHRKVDVPTGLDKAAQIQAMTQQWANALGRAIRQSPSDWHMFQRVFVEDLDPVRLDAIREEVRNDEPA